MPPSRKEATAISLAALRMAGLAPPSPQRLPGEAERREALEIGRLEIERADLRPGRAARRASPSAPARPGCRRSGSACRARRAGRAPIRRHIRPGCGSPIAGGRRSRTRPRRAGTGGRPRSARAPCSSGSRNRPRSWRPSTNWDGRPPRPGVAARISSRRPVAERPAAGGEDDPPDRSRAGRGRSIGRSRYARNRPAAASRRCAAPPRSSDAPAETSASLLASATVPPPRERRHRRLAGRRCRRSPPSSSRRPSAAASRIARLARRGLDAGSGERVRERLEQALVADHGAAGADPRRRLGEAGDVAMRRSARARRSARGSRSIRSSVERPTEPVAPRMVTRAPPVTRPEPGDQDEQGRERRPASSPSSRSSTPPWPGRMCRCP